METQFLFHLRPNSHLRIAPVLNSFLFFYPPYLQGTLLVHIDPALALFVPTMGSNSRLPCFAHLLLNIEVPVVNCITPTSRSIPVVTAAPRLLQPLNKKFQAKFSQSIQAIVLHGTKSQAFLRPKSPRLIVYITQFSFNFFKILQPSQAECFTVVNTFSISATLASLVPSSP